MPRRSRARRNEAFALADAKLKVLEARNKCTRLIHPYINSDNPGATPGCRKCDAVLAWWNEPEQRAIRDAAKAAAAANDDDTHTEEELP